MYQSTRVGIQSPTLIDRLHEIAGEERADSRRESVVTDARMREIIRRDLTYLLNSSNLGDCIDHQRFPRVSNSTLNFGVAPLAGKYAISKSWLDVARIIRQAIIDFEPRLIAESVEILPLQDSDEMEMGSYGVLRFEVNGLIYSREQPLEFGACSEISLDTGKISFEECQRHRR